MYFGSGAYGVRALPRSTSGIARSADLAPRALLAGLIANPDRYDPTRFPDIADERRTLALLRLLETGKSPTSSTPATSMHRCRPSGACRPNGSPPATSSKRSADNCSRILASAPPSTSAPIFCSAVVCGCSRRTTRQHRRRPRQPSRLISPMTSGAFPPRLPRSSPARVVSERSSAARFRRLRVQHRHPEGASDRIVVQAVRVLASAFEKGFVPADQINGIGTCEFANPGGFPNPYEANNFSGPERVRLQRFAHRPSHRRTVRIFDSA